MLTIADFTKTNIKGVTNKLPLELEANFNRIRPYIEALMRAHPSAVLNSGYRSEALNKRIGGSATSYHKLALAADIDSNASNALIFKWVIDNVPFDYVIWEKGTDLNPDWVHFQLPKAGAEPRRIIHRFYNRSGKFIYRECDRNGKLLVF